MDKEEYTFNSKIDGKDCAVTLSIAELAEMGVVGDKGNGNHGRDVLISSMNEYPEK